MVMNMKFHDDELVIGLFATHIIKRIEILHIRGP